MIEINEDEARTLRIFVNRAALVTGNKLPRDLAIKIGLTPHDMAYPRDAHEQRLYLDSLKFKYNRKY